MAKMSLQYDISEQEHIYIFLLLRYRTLSPSKYSFTFMPLQEIQKILKLKMSQLLKLKQYVELNILNKHSQTINETIDYMQLKCDSIFAKERKRKLNTEQILYMTNQNTLIEQSGKTLQERCKMFHRQYPHLKISASFLSNLYKSYNIKKKSIVIKKKYHENKYQSKKQVMAQAIRKQLISLENQDEVMFTYNTVYSKEYSNKTYNIEIQERLIQSKTRAVVASVSKKNGLEYFQIFDRSVNIDKFMDFISNLRKKCHQEKIALYLDNMRVHHSLKVKRLCADLDIPLVFNIPYSPELNPIENCFSLIKNTYKRQKLHFVAQDKSFNVDQLINHSFKKQDSDKIRRICQSGYQRIMNQL